jgi:ATP-dependent DNA helicase RecQ
VEQTTDYLVREGVRAAPYHAGLADEVRERNQEAFQRDDVDVVVATIAFGMGIDKSNVRFVIHRDMPKDVESWYQEMGRAGRDGLESDCVLFYSWADVKQHERFLDDIDDPDLWHAKRQATVDLFRMVESGRCRHQTILAHFDEAMGACGTSCDVCTGRPSRRWRPRRCAAGRRRVAGPAREAVALRPRRLGRGGALRASAQPPQVARGRAGRARLHRLQRQGAAGDGRAPAAWRHRAPDRARRRAGEARALRRDLLREIAR